MNYTVYMHWTQIFSVDAPSPVHVCAPDPLSAPGRDARRGPCPDTIQHLYSCVACSSHKIPSVTTETTAAWMKTYLKYKNAFQWDAYRPIVTVRRGAGGSLSRGSLCRGGGVFVQGGLPDRDFPQWTESETGVKTLPCRNFFAGGKNPL